MTLLASRRRLLRFALIGFSCVIALIPIVRILVFIHQNIQNVLSVDDVMISPLIGKILEGKYSWYRIFRDTFINGHFQFWPILIQLGFAKFARWSVPYLLYFGISLGIFKSILIYCSFTSRFKDSYRWLLFPLISLLVFSPTQLTVYEFEFPSIQLGINHLGFVLGLWGLMRWRGRGAGLVAMVLGGCLASWSWANGVLVWPVYLVGLIFLRAPRRAYLVWWAAALLLSYPYFHFLFLSPVKDLYPLVEQRPESYGLPFVSIFNLSFFIRGIGWPLADDLLRVSSWIRGVTGAVLIAGGGWIVAKQWKSELRSALAAPVMVLVFGLLNIWQVSLFRWVMAPWYASPFMMVWIGLLGLAYVFSQDRPWFFAKQGKGAKAFDYFRHLWAEAVLLLTVLFYVTSSVGFAQQSFYAKTKSRASQSCLRNFATGPTYCERELFLWDAGQLMLMSRMGKPLEQHQLSVFSPKRTLTLQGDYYLDDVKVRQVNWVPEVSWAKNLSSRRTSFRDVEARNLFVHTPNAIDWKVNLPKHLKNAELRSAAAVSADAPFDKEADGAFAQVFIFPVGQDPVLAYSRFIEPSRREWVPFVVSLLPYQGQSITIRLTSQMNTGILHDWMMYRAPEILIEAGEMTNEFASSPVAPSNTDLSPLFVSDGDQDFVFDVTGNQGWHKTSFENLSPVLRGTWLFKNMVWQYQQPLDLCLANYSHLVVRISVPESIYYRAVKMSLFFGNIKKEIELPLLKDGSIHAYSYDLKLLEMPRGTPLTGIRLALPEKAHTNVGDRIRLQELRLIRQGEGNFCR